MPNITWLGDDDLQLQTITEGGITFVKGQPVNVNRKHMYGGANWFEKLSENPRFSADADDVDDATPTERDTLKAELDKRGIGYARNATDDVLRKKLADAVAGVVEDGAVDLSVNANADPNAPAVPVAN